MVATAEEVLHKKVDVARWRPKERRRVRARGLSVLLLHVVALPVPSPASLASATFCTWMGMDLGAQKPFLLALSSWQTGFWVVHSRKMREGEGEGQPPPCACGPCSTSVRPTAVRKMSGIATSPQKLSIQRGVHDYCTGGLHAEFRGCGRFACVRGALCLCQRSTGIGQRNARIR